MVNIIYFLANNPSEMEKAFFNKSRTFREAIDDLDILEKIKSKKFNSARNKIAFYEENARITKRKYLYYADRIEEGYVRLFLGKFLSKRDVFKKLDAPVKWHFLFVLAFCAIILLAITVCFLIIAISHFHWLLFFVGCMLLYTCLRFFVYIISFNCAVFYGIINLILYLFGTDRSKLFKNTGILDFLTSKWRAFNTQDMVIGAATIGSLHSFSGGGFGGFGGGSFGGGGAGGSW